MFVNCPFCRGLVATDPVTDQPPERCPRCSAPLREAPGATATAAGSGSDAGSGVAAAMAEAFGTGGDDADGRTAGSGPGSAPQPVISIANLLQPGPATIVPATPPPVAVTASAVDARPAAPAAAAAAGSAEETGPGTDPVPGAGRTPSGAAAPGAPGAVVEPVTPAVPRSTSGAPEVPARPRRATPSFARSRRAPTAPTASDRRWPLPAAITGLTLLLALQWLLADRARLAADPSWRPVVATACGLLGCSLPPWREPSAFVLLERDVRPHPEAAGALRITASFRNDAAWAQPWPEVVLTLSDVDNRPLGTRAFQPAEYLGNVPPAALVEAGQGAVIRMDVLEPGPGAVGFSFDFR